MAPRILRSIISVLHTLKTPPSVQALSPSYHAARQEQLLYRLAKHFKKDPRHPATLLGKTLLDAGCGTAPIGCTMALAGAEVTAIDPNKSALQAAKLYAESFGTPLMFIHSNAEGLLSSPARYQVILALDVLATHANPGKLIWVLSQLLAPGGILVLGHTTRSLRAWAFHVFFSQIITRRVAPNGFSWRHFHTPAALTELTTAAGLQHHTTDLFRYSLNGQKWKSTKNRHLATRYLATFTPVIST